MLSHITEDGVLRKIMSNVLPHYPYRKDKPTDVLWAYLFCTGVQRVHFYATDNGISNHFHNLTVSDVQARADSYRKLVQDLGPQLFLDLVVKLRNLCSAMDVCEYIRLDQLPADEPLGTLVCDRVWQAVHNGQPILAVGQAPQIFPQGPASALTNGLRTVPIHPTPDEYLHEIFLESHILQRATVFGSPFEIDAVNYLGKPNLTDRGATALRRCLDLPYPEHLDLISGARTLLLHVQALNVAIQTLHGLVFPQSPRVHRPFVTHDRVLQDSHCRNAISSIDKHEHILPPRPPSPYTYTTRQMCSRGDLWLTTRYSAGTQMPDPWLYNHSSLLPYVYPCFNKRANIVVQRPRSPHERWEPAIHDIPFIDHIPDDGVSMSPDPIAIEFWVRRVFKNPALFSHLKVTQRLFLCKMLTMHWDELSAPPRPAFHKVGRRYVKFNSPLRDFIEHNQGLLLEYLPMKKWYLDSTYHYNPPTDVLYDINFSKWMSPVFLMTVCGRDTAAASAEIHLPLTVPMPNVHDLDEQRLLTHMIHENIEGSIRTLLPALEPQPQSLPDDDFFSPRIKKSVRRKHRTPDAHRRTNKLKSQVKKSRRDSHDNFVHPECDVTHLPRRVRRIVAKLASEIGPTPQGETLDYLRSKLRAFRERLLVFFVDGSPLRTAALVLLDFLGTILTHPLTLFLATCLFLYWVSTQFGLVPAVVAAIAALWFNIFAVPKASEFLNRMIRWLAGDIETTQTLRQLGATVQPTDLGLFRYTLKFDSPEEAEAFSMANQQYIVGITSKTACFYSKEFLDLDTKFNVRPILNIQPQADGDGSSLRAAIFSTLFGVTTFKDANERFTFGNHVVRFVKEAYTQALELYAYLYTETTGKPFIPPKYRRAVHSIAALNERASAVLTAMRNGENLLSTAANRDKLLKLQLEYDQLHQFLSVNPPPQTYMNSFLSISNEIKKTVASVTAALKGQSKRVPPVSVYIYGPPGVGKSTVMLALAQRAKFLTSGTTYSDIEIYTRNLGDPFWSGYSDAKKVIQMDDVFQMKDDKITLNTINEYVCLVNDVPYCLNMAELNDKGTTFAAPEILLSSSNLEGLPRTNLVTDIEALHRRLHFSIFLSKRDFTDRSVNSYDMLLTHVDGVPASTKLHHVCTAACDRHNPAYDPTQPCPLRGFYTIANHIANRLKYGAPQLDELMQGVTAPPDTPDLAIKLPVQITPPTGVGPPAHTGQASAAAQPNPQGDELFAVDETWNISSSVMAVPDYAVSTFQRLVEFVRRSARKVRDAVTSRLDPVIEMIRTANLFIRSSWNAIIKGLIAFGFIAATAGVVTALLYWANRAKDPEPTPEGRGAMNQNRGDKARNVQAAQALAPRHHRFHPRAPAEKPRQSGSDSDDTSAVYDVWLSRMQTLCEHFEDGMTENMHRAADLFSGVQDSPLPQNVRDVVTNRILPAICRIRRQGQNAFATIIDQFTLMTVAHFLPSGPLSVIQIMHGGDTYTARHFTVIRPVQGADICFIVLDKEREAPFHVKSIRHLFPTNPRPISELWQVRRFSNTNHLVSPVYDARDNPDLHYTDYYMRAGARRAVGLSIDGDSGSLLIDPKDGFICGLHVAGATTEVEHVIWYYTLHAGLLPPPTTVTEVRLPEFASGPLPQCLPENCHFNGLTPTPAFIPKKTSFLKSPFYGSTEFQPCTKEPAALANTGHVQPLKTSLDKAPQMPTYTPKPDELERIIQSILVLLPRPSLGRGTHYLTREQAISGIPGTSVKKLDPRTSSGNNWARQGLSPKAELLTPENRPKLDAACDQLEGDLESGVPIVPEFVACLKDELRKLAKVKAGLSRLICYTNTEFVVIWRQYFGVFFAALVDGHRTCPIKVGLNAHDREWAEVYDRVLMFSEQLMSGDLKNKDWATNEILFRISFEVRERWFKLHFGTSPDFERRQRIRRMLYCTLFRGLLTIGKHSASFSFRLFSGHPGTTDSNCTDLMAMDRIPWETLTRSPVSDFNDCVREAIYGDDEVMAVLRAYPEFNMIDFANFLKEFLGMTYTSTRKDAELSRYDQRHEVTFLKRSFVVADGTVQAPLPREILDDSIQWMKTTYLPGTDTPVPANVLMADKARSYLLEFSHYSYDAFIEARDRLTRACIVHNVRVPQLSYDAAKLERVIANNLTL